MMGNGKTHRNQNDPSTVWKCAITAAAFRWAKWWMCVSKINTGGKYDSGAFQKSVGLNGVGTKAVNALSSLFQACSRSATERPKARSLNQGALLNESRQGEGFYQPAKRDAWSRFEPDGTIFKNFRYIPQYLDNMIWNYCYLNAGIDDQLQRAEILSPRMACSICC
jgi:topoisomerase-4 subunit B